MKGLQDIQDLDSGKVDDGDGDKKKKKIGQQN